MKNGKKGAYPKLFLTEHGDISSISGGLTKREYFAGLAMQGMLSNPNTGTVENGSRMVDPIGVAKGSLIFADALLNELSKI
jgi:hypothetical protein